MLAPVFPMNLIEQEVSTQALDRHPRRSPGASSACGGPAPLYRARRLEKALGTPARIYYKNEGVSPAGSHKPNTAVPQAWYNKQFGIKRLTTETGAGQWGSALAFACALIGLECKVFMVRISFDQKPFRKLMMETWGAQLRRQPVSTETKAGRDILAKMPDTPGSLGIAISEAIEAAVTDPTGKTRYSLGSVLNHVHAAPDDHRPGGQEAARRRPARRSPTWSSAAPAAAANFAGLAFPFVADKINGAKIDIIPVEPDELPDDDPRPVRLRPRRHGQHDAAAAHALAGPRVRARRRSTPAACATTAWRRWSARRIVEGLLDAAGRTSSSSATRRPCCGPAPKASSRAPETSHAIAAAIDEAKKAKEEGKEKVILFNWSRPRPDGPGRLRQLLPRASSPTTCCPKRTSRPSLEAIKHMPKPPPARAGSGEAVKKKEPVTRSREPARVNQGQAYPACFFSASARLPVPCSRFPSFLTRPHSGRPILAPLAHLRAPLRTASPSSGGQPAACAAQRGFTL